MKFLATRRGWSIASVALVLLLAATATASLVAAPASVDPPLARAEGLIGLGLAALAAALLLVVTPLAERRLAKESR